MKAEAMKSKATIREEFEREGFTILRGFFAPPLVLGARQAMQTLVEREAQKLLAAGKITDPQEGEPLETRLAGLYRDFPLEAPALLRRELHLPGLYPLFFHPGLLDIAQIFLGGEIRLYPNYSARPKLPEHAPTRVLWHQDGGYTAQGAGAETAALRMINVWTPLVPATVENGCMQFLPGTHRLGLAPHRMREHYLEIEEAHIAPRRAQAVAIELEPGDVVLFHNLLYHQGLPNRSCIVRWSLDWRYQDAAQPTLRKEAGHLARSRSQPQMAVSRAEEWAERRFG